MSRTVRQRTRRAYPLALAFAVGTPSLSACSVELVDQGSTQSPTSPSPQPESPAPEPVDTPTHPSDDSSSDDTSTGTCRGGELTLETPGAYVTLDVDCPEVYVEADGVTLVAQNIDTLVVAATGSLVEAETIGSVSITGTGNTVRWRTGSPTVTDDGTANLAQQEDS